MQLEELMFKLSLRDQVTGPAGKVQKALDNVARQAKKAFIQVGTGAVGLWGAGESMTAMLDPARDMNRALAEVESLGVDGEALDTLNSKALDFAMQYGASADAVAASAYDIQSSISGLSGDELASFTQASNVLAKATKADAGTITAYTGTMYGIFKNQADKMGKAQWVEQLAGQTATAVKMFKTTGMEMSAAFTSIGANATAAGVDAAEQMAVLGTLQSTMSGSEAGTKYKAFLAGVGQAQDKLGLKFTDANGNMLGMVDILEKLRGKFGDSFDVAESDALKSAFGSDEAVSLIKLLMADTTGLGKSIESLGQIGGMEQAEKMAGKMIDPFDRLAASGHSLSAILGQALLPAINPIVSGVSDAAMSFKEWGEEHPALVKALGWLIALIASFTAMMSIAAIAAGVMRISTMGLKTTLWPMLKVIQLGKAIWAAYAGGQWLANSALLAFPGTWIVVGLLALVGAVAAVIYWWDDLKSAFLDTSWGDCFTSLLDSVMGFFGKLGGIVGWVIKQLNRIPGVNIEMPGGEKEEQSEASAVSAPKQAMPVMATAQEASSVGAVPAAAVAVPELPGLHPTGSSGRTKTLPPDAVEPAQRPMLNTPRQPRVAPGGVTQHVQKTVSSQSSQSSVHVDKVVINHDGELDAAALKDALLMGVS